MPKLFLCVDPGGSQTKIIYQLTRDKKPRYLSGFALEGRWKMADGRRFDSSSTFLLLGLRPPPESSKIWRSLFTGGSESPSKYSLCPLPSAFCPRSIMPPEVEQIKEDNLKRYLEKESSMSNPSAIRQAYLEVKERTFVVGYFASKFDPEDRLIEIKYENALYKTLAAVGVIAESSKLNPKKISLQLGVLLPWNEYEDREKFYNKLKEYLSNFVFRGLSFSVQLDKFICRPEGGGLAAIYTRKKGSDWQQDKKLGILMFGHRNITALCFEYGELTGDSPLIGFSKFLDNVIDRTSGLDRDRIAGAIFKGLESKRTENYSSSYDANHTNYPQWSSLDAISELANAKDRDLRALEIREVSDAIDIATEEYWATVSKWLAKIFPADLDEVVISGGASK